MEDSTPTTKFRKEPSIRSCDFQLFVSIIEVVSSLGQVYLSHMSI